jgi:hypothetical protein
MTRGMLTLLALFFVLTQASCTTTEEVAVADELRQSCELGEVQSVSSCGGAFASCHVCGRPEGESVCLQPCTVGRSECPGSQRCVPIDSLAQGYARVGDCPAGFCQ